MAFFLFFILIVIQRLIELVIAKRNERFMKEKGALEFGKSHYPVIVIIHSMFFISFLIEVVYFEKDLSPIWPLLLMMFLLTQAGRLWALFSLGIYWNTKILVLPNASIIKRGPYRVMKHPNYFIVSLEFLIIPLLFQAYVTAVIFTILNAFILAIRIPTEERALKLLTPYEQAFEPTASNEKDLEKV